MCLAEQAGEKRRFEELPPADKVRVILAFSEFPLTRAELFDYAGVEWEALSPEERLGIDKFLFSDVVGYTKEIYTERYTGSWLLRLRREERQAILDGVDRESIREHLGKVVRDDGGLYE